MGFLGIKVDEWDTCVCKVCGKTFRMPVIHGRHFPSDVCLECRKKQDQAKAMEQFWRDKLKDRQIKAGIPERFRSVTLDSFVITQPGQRQAVGSCRSFVNGVGSNMVLTGPTGVGKTHLAVAVMNEMMRSDPDRTYRYTSEAELYRVIRETYALKTSERKALNQLSSYWLLAIDEMGRATWSESDKRILFDLVNARYNSGTRTIIASNMTSRSFDHAGRHYVGLDEYLGEATARRIVESKCVEVQCTWPRHKEEA